MTPPHPSPPVSVVRRARPAGRGVLVGAVAAAVLAGCSRGSDDTVAQDSQALVEALRVGPTEQLAAPATVATPAPSPSADVPAEAYPVLRDDGNAFNAERRRFARDVLRGLGLPETPQNLVALLAWAVAESGAVETKARNNPLNTAWIGSAVDKVEGETRYNEVGVMHFETYEQGLEATLVKLRNDEYYQGITDALRAGNDPMAVALAVAASPWGTKDGVVKVLRNSEGWPQFQIDPAFRAPGLEGPGR